MNSYAFSTGVMDLATTASGSVVFALNNPSGSGKNLILKRCSARYNYVGVPGATRVPIAFNRATGTAAAGTKNKATTGIPKRQAGSADSIATAFAGPTPITGLTDSSPEDILKATSIPSQIGAGVWDEIIEDVKNVYETDCIIIVPGTSFVARLAAISIAGTGLEIDIEWAEQ